MIKMSRMSDRGSRRVTMLLLTGGDADCCSGSWHRPELRNIVYWGWPLAARSRSHTITNIVHCTYVQCTAQYRGKARPCVMGLRSERVTRDSSQRLWYCKHWISWCQETLLCIAGPALELWPGHGDHCVIFITSGVRLLRLQLITRLCLISK